MTWTVEGRNVLITGGNSGIGKAAATELARRGAMVTITARDEEKGRAASADIRAAVGASVEVLHLDLADLDSVRAAAAEFLDRHDRLAVLVNNAGALFGRRRETIDGHEMTLATNYLGPFLLTDLLTDALVAAAPSRVINVGSSGHGYAKQGIKFDDLESTGGYRTMEVYGHSKLANILHARELDRRLGSDGVAAYSLHPGLVRSSIGRDGDAWVIALGARLINRRMIDAEEGADTIVWLATTDPAPEPRGGYFEKRAEARSSRHARDDDMARRLYDTTVEMLDIEAMPDGRHV